MKARRVGERRRIVGGLAAWLLCIQSSAGEYNITGARAGTCGS